LGGSQRGKNSIYVVQIDGLRLCHLGDLGHNLTREQIEKIGAVDILFLPVGGGPTIELDTASLIAERLKPKMVVPMHYNPDLPGMATFLNNFHRVDDFLKNKKNIKKIGGRSFSIAKENLPKEQTIMVLSSDKQ